MGDRSFVGIVLVVLLGSREIYHRSLAVGDYQSPCSHWEDHWLISD